MKLSYTKLIGAGNDFVLVDTLQGPSRGLRARWPRVAQALCDRRQGVGADGLLVLGPSRSADVRMRIFNPDGSEPTMCGNGIRCLAWYAHRFGGAGTRLAIETGAGRKQARIEGRHRVRINMGRPRLRMPSSRISLGAGSAERAVDAVMIDSGVPHLVCWVEDVSAVDVERIGRRLRRRRQFSPQGVNVDFVQWEGGVIPARGSRRLRLKMRTYERGVEGETRACGTGAVAVGAAACALLADHRVDKTAGRRRNGSIDERTRDLYHDVEVRVSGGLLRVRVGCALDAKGQLIFTDALLEGDARQTGRGTIAWKGAAAGR